VNKLKPIEQVTPVNHELLHCFAMRILSLSSAMGLDDQDEQLLWEYLATVGQERIESDCAPIARFLRKEGEGEALLLKSFHYTATMDKRFDNRPSWRKLLRPLEKKESLVINKVVFLDEPEGKAYVDKIIENIKVECFNQWYPHLCSIQRENGVDWNPPETSDIEIIGRTYVSLLVPAGISRLSMTCQGQATNEIHIG
jgi:hypothetical protein